MTPSPEKPSDRRAVPRHLRDSEHEMEAAGESGGAASPGRGWFYSAVAVAAAGASLWLGFNHAGTGMSADKWAAISGVVAVLAGVLAMYSFRRVP